MEINPTLSIIIVNFNTKELLSDCLNSIKGDKGLGDKIPTEIIVVDNGSTDGSREYLRNIASKKYRNIEGQKSKSLNLYDSISLKLIENKFNLGFAKANNQGIKIARGQYILLLNSDTIILNSAISQTLLWLSSHSEVGVVSGQLLNKDKTIQATGGFFPNLGNVLAWSLFLDDLPFFNRIVRPIHPHADTFYTKDKWYNQTRGQDWVTGAFLMARKSVLEEVDGLNEDFFMYAEELEMCYRIKKKGWEIFYLNGPQVIHLGGASSKTSETALIGEYLGLKKFFEIHKPRWQKPILRLLLKVNALARWLVFGIIKGDREKRTVYGKAVKKI